MSGNITVAGFAASTKTPGTYLAVVLGGPGTSAGAAPITELHIGNMIGTAISASSPAYSLPVGTQSGAYATPVPVYSPADAATKFGSGSELHMMAQAAFLHDPAATILAIPSQDGATAAQGDFLFSMASGSNPSAAGTVTAIVCGRPCSFTFGTSDTVATIATGICAAINQQSNWPVYAQTDIAPTTPSTACVSLLPKNAGVRGNNITYRIQVTSGASSATGSSAATTPAVANVQVGLGSAAGTGGKGAAVGGVMKLSGGVGEETPSTGTGTMTQVLAAIDATRYGRIVCAQTNQDGTNLPLTAIKIQVLAQAGPNTGIRQQVIAARTDANSNAQTLAGIMQSPRVQIVAHYNSDWTTGEVAAAVAASRVAGDGNIGGQLRGEAAIPSANLDNLRLLIPAQFASADAPSPTVIEASLNNGVTILGVRGTSGFAYLTRSITTQFHDALGNPNYAVIDTEYVTVGDWVADTLQTAYATDYAGFNVEADDPGGSPPQIQLVTTPSLTAAWIFKNLKDYEGQGILQGVDSLQSVLSVVLDSTPGRLDAEIPFKPVYNLHQLAGNVRQVS